MTHVAEASQNAARPVVLLVNLGTPDSPTPTHVRRFLREFLTDRRVIEYPQLLWRPLLEGIILRIRPRRVAHAYSAIWTEEGSPLLVGTLHQRDAMQRALGSGVLVKEAMCYGTANVTEVLDELHEQGYSQVVVLPAYPQYSASTVGAIFDLVARWMLTHRNQMNIRMVRSWETHDTYIRALAAAMREHWAEHGAPDFAAGDTVIASFHSIPAAMKRKGDPYQEECEATAQALRSELGLGADQLVTTYQSVFGPAEWIGPATIDTVEDLGKKQTGRLDVICPGFVADCLETVEEIGIQNREAFISAGGGQFHYVPWGNGSQACVEALVQVARENLAGWVEC